MLKKYLVILDIISDHITNGYFQQFYCSCTPLTLKQCSMIVYMVTYSMVKKAFELEVLSFCTLDYEGKSHRLEHQQGLCDK